MRITFHRSRSMRASRGLFRAASSHLLRGPSIFEHQPFRVSTGKVAPALVPAPPARGRVEQGLRQTGRIIAQCLECWIGRLLRWVGVKIVFAVAHFERHDGDASYQSQRTSGNEHIPCHTS